MQAALDEHLGGRLALPKSPGHVGKRQAGSIAQGEGIALVT